MPGLVYLETSFISAFVTDRTDAVSVYRRDASREWWAVQASRYELSISAEVVAELMHPTYRHSEEALDLIEGIPLLPINDQVRGLAELLVRERVMPGPVAGDTIQALQRGRG